MRQKIYSISAAFLLLFLTVFSSFPAFAAGGLEFYTDYPGISVKAGDSQTISMYVSNTSGSGLDADLSIVSIPDGWEGYFSGSGSQISRVHVENGAESTVTFNLEIPEDAAEGDYTVQLQATSDTELTDVTDLVLSIQEVQYGQGSFEAEYPEQEGASGTAFSFSTTLVNNSAADQSYSLSAQAPAGWQVSFQPSGESTQVASIEVAAASSEGLTVSVTPPENVEAGDYTIPISATSASDTLETELTVTITGTYALELSTPSGLLSFDAHANRESDVTLSITNNSNVDLQNITLTSSAPTDWTVTFDESSIEVLEAGATQEITAHVTPGDSAMTGDYVTTITASCSETSDTAEFRVSVKTDTIWGIVAIVIILALVAGVGAVFKKYGRR
ncbi:COG1470 family protein [Lachnoclostridium sp. An196]|uniref:COG1470 family protein n=1 Tax=Lachnoclostridium sp. An196 TaxID=1965583 RepID=UPI001FA92EBD|nr:NEW3 domain-containing protein [Lachnoclostridium sp. An196]